jgi:F0F1-type ATP synthase assembly protein I
VKLVKFLGPDGRKQLKLANRVSAVGLELVLAISVGYFGGTWLDGRFDTAPYLGYFGLFVGIFAGFKGLWSFAKRTDLDRIDD